MSRLVGQKNSKKVIKQKPTTNKGSKVLDTFTSRQFGKAALLDTGFRVQNQPVYSLQINGRYTREQIYNHVDQKSQELLRKEPNTKFQVVLKFKITNYHGIVNYEYRSGKFVNAGEHPDIYDRYNYQNPFNDDDDDVEEEIVGFYINLIRTNI